MIEGTCVKVETLSISFIVMDPHLIQISKEVYTKNLYCSSPCYLFFCNNRITSVPNWTNFHDFCFFFKIDCETENSINS